MPGSASPDSIAKRRQREYFDSLLGKQRLGDTPFNAAPQAPKIGAKKKSTRLRIPKTLYPPHGTRYQKIGTGLYVFNEELELMNWVHDECTGTASVNDKRDSLAQFMTEYMYTNSAGQIVDFRYYMKKQMYHKARKIPFSVWKPLQASRTDQVIFEWYVKFVNAYNTDYKLGMQFGKLPVGGEPRTRSSQFRQ